MAAAEDVTLAVNNLKRQYVPESLRIFEEDRELRKAYNAYIRAVRAQKHEEAEEKRGRIKELLKAHNQEAKDMKRALELYKKFFENLFADMSRIEGVLAEQVKIDYEMRQQKAPKDIVQAFAQSDFEKAKAFGVVMGRVSDMSRSLK
ncbi:MAG: hypothetical protein KJ922_01550, partial [Nanoarchaeota archaeon]|nr:hypothetical protein [Nanoarchaeota archaeon]